jgi:WhiB family redox-sensing transcriptional regulator
MLAKAGVGLKTVAAVSGVSTGALSKLVYGKRGRAPSRRIRPDTMARILAVTPNAAADGARVPAAPIWALIDEMIAAGVPRVRIAEHIGQTGPGLQLGHDMVSAAHARTIRALHADWTAGRVQLTRHTRHGAPRPVAAPTREPDYIDRAAILLDLAELLEAANDQPWRRDAACRGRDPHIWHPADTDTRMIAAAKRICAACLVRTQCLSAHLDHRDGIFGGLTPAERRDRRRMEVRAG